MLAGVAQVQQIAAKFPQILVSSFATANRREALGMGSQEANAIHAKLGIPARFS
jgi:hypothetical protein